MARYHSLAYPNECENVSQRMRNTNSAWELWVPRQLLANETQRLSTEASSFLGTPLGTYEIDRIPREELEFGQRSSWLQQGRGSTIAASDGSLTADHRLGAAFTLITGDARLKEEQETLDGDPDITRAELHSLTMAVTASPPDKDLLVLTDSAGVLRKLAECQHDTFRRQFV